VQGVVVNYHALIARNLVTKLLTALNLLVAVAAAGEEITVPAGVQAVDAAAVHLTAVDVDTVAAAVAAVVAVTVVIAIAVIIVVVAAAVIAVIATAMVVTMTVIVTVIVVTANVTAVTVSVIADQAAMKTAGQAIAIAAPIAVLVQHRAAHVVLETSSVPSSSGVVTLAV